MVLSVQYCHISPLSPHNIIRNTDCIKFKNTQSRMVCVFENFSGFCGDFDHSVISTRIIEVDLRVSLSLCFYPTFDFLTRT